MYVSWRWYLVNKLARVHIVKFVLFCCVVCPWWWRGCWSNQGGFPTWTGGWGVAGFLMLYIFMVLWSFYYCFLIKFGLKFPQNSTSGSFAASIDEKSGPLRSSHVVGDQVFPLIFLSAAFFPLFFFSWFMLVVNITLKRLFFFCGSICFVWI